MIVSISGVDGSGKTTLVESIRASLLEEGEKVFVFHEFKYLLPGFLIRSAGKGTLFKVNASPPSSRRSGFITRMIPYAVWVDLLFQHFYFRLFKRNVIVLRDRQAFDHLMTWKELGFSNWFVEALYRLLPRPDVAFFLDVDASEAYERRSRQAGKMAKPRDFYVMKVELYRRYWDNRRMIRIDGDTKSDEALDTSLRFVHLRKKFLRFRTIALSGIDGSGKSTTIHELSSLLRKMNIPVRILHFYFSYIPIKLVKLLVRGSGEDEKKRMKESVENEQKVAARGKSRLWIWYVIGDALVQYWFVRIFFFRRLLVLDRYFDDFLVSFDFIGVPYDRDRLVSFFPRADRHFLQLADPEILYRRKPEHSLGFFKTCRNSYLDLARQNGWKVLDSSRKNETEVMDELLESL